MAGIAWHGRHSPENHVETPVAQQGIARVSDPPHRTSARCRSLLRAASHGPTTSRGFNEMVQLQVPLVQVVYFYFWYNYIRSKL